MANDRRAPLRERERAEAKAKEREILMPKSNNRGRRRYYNTMNPYIVAHRVCIVWMVSHIP